MKHIRHTADQFIRRLKASEQLIAQRRSVAVVCRAIEVSQPTFHRCKHQYGNMHAEEAKWLPLMEEENANPKKPLAEAELEKRCSF